MIKRMQKCAISTTLRNHWYVYVFYQTIDEHIRFILTGVAIQMNYINSSTSRILSLYIQNKVYQFHNP